MNNESNNSFNEENNLNNNIVQEPVSSISNDSLTTSQTQITNEVVETNVSPAQQINNQFDNVSNVNITDANNVVQTTDDNTVVQNINSVNEINSQVNVGVQQQVSDINPVLQNNNVNPVVQSTDGSSQSLNNSTSTEDEELLRAFIGNNYSGITSHKFNLGGLLLPQFYMLYRKMILYGILLSILYFGLFIITKNIFILFVINIFMGFLMNKIYLFYAKRKINKFKIKNPQMSIEDLKVVCSKKGGSSLGHLFLGIIAQIGIILVISGILTIIGFNILFDKFLGLDDLNFTDNNNSTNKTNIEDGILLEDIKISGYSCSNSKCNVFIGDFNNSEEYVFDGVNAGLFVILDDYKDYVKVNIYYTKKNDKKTIVNYKLYSKINNEEMMNINNEDELRNKIGLYSTGKYTDSFTLIDIGMEGLGYNNGKTYNYVDYTLKNSKNNEFEMKYIMLDKSKELNLVVGNTYIVTFEVVKGTFDYEYTIESIN